MARGVTCTRCGARRFRSEFYPNPRKKNGLDSWCKFCRRKESARYARLGYEPRKPKPEPEAALARGGNKGKPSGHWLDRLTFWPPELDLRDPRKLKSREV